METNDKSLLRCTIKKSADVVKKLVMYASYIIVAAAAVASYLYGIVGIWNAIQDPIKYAVALLVGIPWYYYAGVVALAAIPVYSLLWCVARELTDEDWNSNKAKDVAFAIAVAGAFAFAIAAAGAFAFAIAFAIAVAGAFAFAIAFAIAPDSKVLLFIGAYLHYRKRVKAE